MTDWSTTSATDFKSSDEWWNDSQSLRDYLTEWEVEIADGMTSALPAGAFHFYFTPEFVDRVDTTIKQEELKQQATAGWTDWFNEEVEVESQELDWAQLRPRNKKMTLMISNPQVIRFVIEQVENHKESLIASKVAQLQPKKTYKNKVGSKKVKRDDSEYDIRWTNTEDSPQGQDYKYYLTYGDTTDENATTIKDGKITEGADGSLKKTKTHKAVRKKDVFLPNTSHCVGANTWDRAGGSQVLSELGIKGSFKMACLEPKEDGSVFCSKCKSKNKQNIYCNTYKSGKVKGMTYAQVLWECSVSGLDKPVIQERVESHGGKWVETETNVDEIE